MEKVKQQGNSFLLTVKAAYNQYINDLKYVKNNSNSWYGKPYKFGFTHFAVAKHWLKSILLK